MWIRRGGRKRKRRRRRKRKRKRKTLRRPLSWTLVLVLEWVLPLLAHRSLHVVVAGAVVVEVEAIASSVKIMTSAMMLQEEVEERKETKREN